MAFQMTSDAFENNATIPKKHTCDGADVSPNLVWRGAPAGTKSFALIMDDPDAPPGTWVHWIVWNIPASWNQLSENRPKQAELPDGIKQGACWGVDAFSRVGYFGPCPPPGKPHRYFFKLYALDVSLSLPPKATKKEVEAAMAPHVLAQATLMGKYGR